MIYGDLHRLAVYKPSQESPEQKLEPTALVHDAYLRLLDAESAQHWDGTSHFFAAEAEAMRRILVEAARHKARGGLIYRSRGCI
jgi:hypothetical protein